MLLPFRGRKQIGGEEGIWTLTGLCFTDGRRGLIPRPAGMFQCDGASEGNFEVA
jgi:hypothetical protein